MVLLSDDVAAAVRALKARLQPRFGDRLLEYVVFGSQARGDAHTGSDVDVFVCIRDLAYQDRAFVYETGAEVWMDTSVRLAPLAMSDREAAEDRRLERRIMRDIDEEGLRL